VSEVLCSPSIDAVAVITPVWTHFELAKAALCNGKHVFVEKPFTSSTAQAEELIELAARKRLTIMVDHTFLFTGAVSKINEKISNLRQFFDKNTYLQVTATPQALFLQESGHSFRPKFTILSHPGHDYVGGNDFFDGASSLVREFDISEITALSPGAQPAPSMSIPASLLRALDTFMIGATYKRKKEADQNCAFLCHVSTLKADHRHIVDLLREYKTKLAAGLKQKQPAMIARLKKAYDDLATTHAGVKGASFDKLVEDIEFFSRGITVKLVNGETQLHLEV